VLKTSADVIITSESNIVVKTPINFMADDGLDTDESELGENEVQPWQDLIPEPKPTSYKTAVDYCPLEELTEPERLCRENIAFAMRMRDAMDL
jgi:hypothetical protein